MGYVDELLSRQIRLAERLETEPEGQALRQFRLRTGRREAAEPEQETGLAGSGAEEAPEKHASRAGIEGEEGSSEALQALSDLQAARARAALLAVQTQSEGQLRTAQQAQGVTLPQMVHSRYEGGMITESAHTMQTAETAHGQTQWSMQEISRFFERDARRYGG